MDKSFNDQELSDIMKEIEALEEDFKGADSELEASPVMEELANMDEEESIPTPVASAPVIQMPTKPTATKAAAASGTSMSFKVSGDMNLELQFDVGGKVVNLNVSENGLAIEMEGGMTFSVPLANAAKKAA